jgi:hypothetical protein
LCDKKEGRLIMDIVLLKEKIKELTKELTKQESEEIYNEVIKYINEK